ncbi:MAG: response regulator transcription factor, partial [Cupriavidus sp.]|nr:response regulator transcription factor [Cupriavidus sp.]
LRKVATGGTYVSPEMAEKLALGVQEQTDAPHASLSDRELEVYRRIVNGESLTEIAEALCVSAKTVSTYKMRLLEKLQLRSDAALVRYAIEANLFPRESPL